VAVQGVPKDGFNKCGVLQNQEGGRVHRKSIKNDHKLAFAGKGLETQIRKLTQVK